MLYRLFLGIFVASLFFSVVGFAADVTQTDETLWPTEVFQCETFHSEFCQYLLCLCYLNVTPPGGKQPNLENQVVCSNQFESCKASPSSAPVAAVE